MTVQVNIHEAKTQLSKLVARAAAGERVVIAKAGKPIADLVMHQRTGVRLGTMKGQIRYDEDEFNSADAEIASMFDFEIDAATGDASP